MTIEAMKKAFVQTLNTQGERYVLSYEGAHEKSLVVKIAGNNIPEIEVCVGFDIMLGGAILITVGYYEFTGFAGKREAAIEACNEINSQIKGKCFVDDEDDVVMTTLIPFNAYGIRCEFSPEQVLLATLDMALDADRAHPILTAVQTAE